MLDEAAFHFPFLKQARGEKTERTLRNCEVFQWLKRITGLIIASLTVQNVHFRSISKTSEAKTYDLVKVKQEMHQESGY